MKRFTRGFSPSFRFKHAEFGAIDEFRRLSNPDVVALMVEPIQEKEV